MPFFSKKKRAEVKEIIIPISDDRAKNMFYTIDDEDTLYFVEWTYLARRLKKQIDQYVEGHNKRYRGVFTIGGCTEYIPGSAFSPPGYLYRGGQHGGHGLYAYEPGRHVNKEHCNELTLQNSSGYSYATITPSPPHPEKGLDNYAILIKRPAHKETVEYPLIVNDILRHLAKYLGEAEMNIRRQIEATEPLRIVQRKGREIETKRLNELKARENLTEQEKENRSMTILSPDVMATLAKFTGTNQRRGNFLSGLERLSRKVAKKGGARARLTRKKNHHK